VNGVLRLSFDDVHKWYNRPSFTDTLKFIVSTQPFEVLGLEKKSLPEPLTPDSMRAIAELEGKRGGFDVEEEEASRPKLSGWNVLTYHFEFQNPEYNKVRSAEVKEMLEAGEELAHFATGLYFQSGKNGGLDASLDTTEAPEAVGEKGFLWDTTLAAANKWAGFWRHRHYKKMVKKNPDLPRFVAEGDSWFQHPLLKDIIDNVGEFYPVYCLSEAGDTIENYLKEGEMFNAFDEINPAGFLLSGGGNDILGESMRGFLSKVYDDAPEGEKPMRFFNEAYESAMQKVINNYRSIFNYLHKNRPDMKVYIHGYDYPRPLPTGEKKGWIGKYFDEFGVLRSGDRSQAVHYMMDEFNKRLSALADEFKGHVEYIDLRQIVKDDQWNDEIHPSDDGYREVSLKFLQRIEATLDVPVS
jgi:lysophospholipase L1-like esterase